MKKLMIVFIVTFYSCAPTLITLTEPFIETFDAPGTKNELYLKANSWMIEVFKDAESVIQHNDKEEGVIIGKYLMYGGVSTGLYGTVNDTRVYAIIDIRVKDGRARFEVKTPSSWRYDPSGMTVYQYSKEQATRDIEELSNSFFERMTSSHVIEF